jgi:alcohol dehydrogenase class IV
VINKQMYQFPIIYTMPINRIAIGWGVHETVADECKQAGIKKALITTTGLKGTGIIDEINQILTGNGIATEIYDKITSNPKDHEVTEAYQVFKNAECDGVVSVGGGSSHDCGKCVRILAANEEKQIYDFVLHKDVPWMEEAKKHKPASVPQITVNTTAGTSAESTCAAMFTVTKSHTKTGMLLPYLAPTVALVDPLLVRLMPQNIAAWTGFDAFAHAFEGYISRLRSRYTAAISLAIIKLVAENLREFTHNRMNHVACENMCWAANMAVALLHFGGSVGIVHGVGLPLTGLTDCHHGHGNAILTLVLERANEASCTDEFAEMAKAMGVDTRGMTKTQAADKWFDEVERLLQDLNIESGNLNKQLGIQKKDLEYMANIYSNDSNQEGNPRDVGYDECLKLLGSML